MIEVDNLHPGVAPLGYRESFRRVRPKITSVNRPFWTAGEKGSLAICRCSDCGTWHHPPVRICHDCGRQNLRFDRVVGTGRIYSYTVNHYEWVPGFHPPYIVATIDIDGCPGVRLISNVVDCDPFEVRIGMAVRVFFVRNRDVHIPIFRVSE